MDKYKVFLLVLIYLIDFICLIGWFKRKLVKKLLSLSLPICLIGVIYIVNKFNYDLYLKDFFESIGTSMFFLAAAIFVGIIYPFPPLLFPKKVRSGLEFALLCNFYVFIIMGVFMQGMIIFMQ